MTSPINVTRVRRTRLEQLWLGVVSAMGLVLVAWVTWFLVQSLGQRVTASPVAVRATPTPTTVQASAKKTSTRSGASIKVTAFGPGVGLPGEFVRFRPTTNGDLDVVEALFAVHPVKNLSLTLPRAEGIAAVATIRPSVTRLTVVADGTPIPLARGGTLMADTRLPLNNPSTMITLTYRLSGVVVRTVPSPSGRSLAVLTPLAVDRSLRAPVIVQVDGPTVLNLVCPQLDLAKQLCGRRGSRQWSTSSLPASSDQVIAQLQLPVR